LRRPPSKRGPQRTREEERPTEAEDLGQIDLTNLFRAARDCGAEELLELLRLEEDRLIDLLQAERLPSGAHRYVRGGHYRRALVTKLGMVVVVITRIRDRLRRRTFSPLLHVLGLSRRRYSRDLRLACAEEATRTSYGEASESIQRSLNVRVPRRTIWNFVQEIAPWAEQGARSVPILETDGAHVADGTFVRSWWRGRPHEVNVAIRQRRSDHKVEVVGLRVGGAAGRVIGPEVERLVTDGALAYSPRPEVWHQLCHVHFLRHLTDLLRDERGLMPPAEREALVRELGGVLAHLRASVAKHSVDGNRVAVGLRIEATLERLGEIGHALDKAGLRQSARFVQDRGRATVVFAEVASRGGWMPATSNGVERVMGMIADRCKRKWAHWNRGLDNMLQLLLIRKTRPAAYSWAVRGYLRGACLTRLAPLGRPRINNP
jgi:hypothetical protein